MSLKNQIVAIPMSIAKAFPIIVILSGVMASVASGKSLGAVFSLGAFLLGGVLNHFLKYMFVVIFRESVINKRPSPPKTGCGVFNNCRNPGASAYGMPSGHAQITTFSFVFWLLYIWSIKTGTTVKAKATVTVAMAVIWIYVLYTRVQLGCHSYFQVSVGTAIGGLLGWGYFVLLQKVFPKVLSMCKKK